MVFFEPENGINGTLSIALVNGTADQPLQPVYTPSGDAAGYPTVGVSTLVELNSSAVLTVAMFMPRDDDSNVGISGLTRNKILV